MPPDLFLQFESGFPLPNRSPSLLPAPPQEATVSAEPASAVQDA